MKRTVINISLLGVPLLLILLAMSVLLLPIRGLWAQEDVVAKEQAKVVDAYGKVERRDNEKAAWRAVNGGDLLGVSSQIRTGDNSAALLQMVGGHILRVGARTTVALNKIGQNREFDFKVLAGQVWSFVRKASRPARYEVETPSAVAGVSGTVFSVSYDESQAESLVTTDNGLVAVREIGESFTNGAPVPVRPGYFVRWERSARPYTAVPQSVGQRQMWRLLRREGWANPRQQNPGGLRLQRNIEGNLIRYLRARSVKATPVRQPRQRQPRTVRHRKK